ncbi:MAG: hypothetical protein VYA61_04810 [Pseudomonadota bacterium]|nr:hypothetical protein [Pseudomonadota bacterium]
MQLSTNRVNEFKECSNKISKLSVNTEILAPKKILFFRCHANSVKSFTSYLSKTFHLSVPKVGFLTEVKGKQLIHATGSLYIFIIAGDGLHKKAMKDLSGFGKIQDLSAGLVMLRIDGIESCQLVNRLVGIDAAAMNNSQNHTVALSSQIGYLSKINATIFELIIPSSYLAYFTSGIDAILFRLDSMKESEIKLDDLFLKLRS